MQHYRGIRAQQSFLELCKNPELAAEVTWFARDWLQVDAAIIFSDILVLLEALGLPLEFVNGDGPRLPRPISSAAEVDALLPADVAADALSYVGAAIRQTVARLPANIPCIGFCGAPFTLASYALEGGGSKTFTRTRAFMRDEPAAWHRLLARLAATGAAHLNRQIAAGATAVQVFDSWVGNLTRDEFTTFAAPHLRALADAVTPGVPVILFGTNTAHLIELIAACGADVIGVDSATDLDAAWRACGGPDAISVQGNLDPRLLLGERDALLDGARAVLHAAAGRPGHIFNLGHGVLKETDPEQVRALVDLVRASG